MKQQEKNKERMDRFIGIVALVAGLVALLFSWQANKIAREANTYALKSVSPDVEVLSINIQNLSVIRQETGTLASCLNVIRISNFGGAATSIIGYEIIGSLSATKYEIDNEEKIKETFNVSSDYSYLNSELYFQVPELEKIASAFLKQITQNLKDDFKPEIDETNINPLPIRIDGNSTIELYNQIVIVTRNPRINIFDQFPYDYTIYEIDSRPKWISGYDGSLLIRYLLKLSSGETIASDSEACLLIRID